jgi:hypothetical protein
MNWMDRMGMWGRGGRGNSHKKARKSAKGTSYSTAGYEGRRVKILLRKQDLDQVSNTTGTKKQRKHGPYTQRLEIQDYRVGVDGRFLGYPG